MPVKRRQPGYKSRATVSPAVEASIFQLSSFGVVGMKLPYTIARPKTTPVQLPTGSQ